MHKFPNSSILKISIPSKSTEVKIFSDHYPNIYHRLSYNFPHYYKFYFNITYCLLITPFRISFKDNGPKIITNPIQTVLCAVVNGSVVILAVLWVRRDVYAKVRDKPDVLFLYASNCAWLWYMVFYIVVFWSRRIHSLLKIPYKRSNWRVRIKGALIILLGFLMVIIYYVVYVVFNDKLVVQPILDNFASTALYVTFQQRNGSRPVRPLSFNQISSTEQAIVLTLLIADLFYNIIISFLELFGLISTIAVFEMTCSFSSIFLKRKSGDIRVLLQHYADMKDVFGKINRVNGPILLIIFIQIIPWISGSLIDILDEEKWPNRAYMLFYYVFYLGLLGFAAEANHKTKIYKKRIHAIHRLEMENKEMLNQNQWLYVKNFMKGTEGATALAGGKFFFVTYSFIGASASALVTFSMIMVQFNMSMTKLSVNSTVEGS